MSQQNYGHVKLPANYYQKEKTAYSNWRQAWFREAIQNEVDAGATQIDFTVENHPEDNSLVRVVCHGNGKGMDKDKLLNVFLVMGGSQKGEDSIGGFGYAKVILAFAHESYKIETHGIEVTGVGGDYTWTEGNAVEPGVRLTVEMKRMEADRFDLEDALRSIVHHSELPKSLTIKFNGERLESNPNRKPYVQQTPLGELSFSDRPGASSASVLWVRMKGLAMFSEVLYTGDSAFEGYLELEGNSKELLTANRDSLSHTHRQTLSQIVNALANDREKLKLGGNIDVTLNRREISFDDLDAGIQSEIRSAAKVSNLSNEEMVSMLKNAAAHGLPDTSPFHLLRKKVEAAQDRVSERLSKIPTQWYPENFKIKHAEKNDLPDEANKQATHISSLMALKRYGKAAVGWKAIIHTLLENEAYRDALGVQKLADGVFEHRDCIVQVGYVFGSPEGLCHRVKEDKEVAILMNPKVVDDQNLTVGDLIDLAHHELTHLNVEYHNESFTMRESTLRRIMRREIGERRITQAYEDAVSQWRACHSEKKVKSSVRRDSGCDYAY